MSVCFTISAKKNPQTVHVEVMGYEVGISALSGSVSIVEVDGKVFIKYFPSDSKKAVDEVSSSVPTSTVTVEDVAISNASVVSADTVASNVIDTVLSESTKTEVQEISKPEFPLFNHLVGLRKKIAHEEGVPVYIIFSNATLKEIEKLMPQDLEALGKVSGIGEAKLSKYGERFLELIKNYIGGSITA